MPALVSFLRRFARNKTASAGLTILGLVVVVAFV
jgi:hypothetical protein